MLAKGTASHLHHASNSRSSRHFNRETHISARPVYQPHALVQQWNRCCCSWNMRSRAHLKCFLNSHVGLAAICNCNLSPNGMHHGVHLLLQALLYHCFRASTQRSQHLQESCTVVYALTHISVDNAVWPHDLPSNSALCLCSMMYVPCPKPN